MASIAEYKARTEAKHPPFPIELDETTLVTLKSIMLLDKDELSLFNASQKKLAKMDEDEDLENMRSEFVSILAGVSSDKAVLAKALDVLPIGVLTEIFTDYASSLKEGAKS